MEKKSNGDLLDDSYLLDFSLPPHSEDDYLQDLLSRPASDAVQGTSFSEPDNPIGHSDIFSPHCTSVAADASHPLMGSSLPLPSPCWDEVQGFLPPLSSSLPDHPPFRGDPEPQASSSEDGAPKMRRKTADTTGRVAESLKRQRAQNRASQRKHRDSVKVRMRTSEQQVQELAAQLEALMSEKQCLEARTKVLEHNAKVADRHVRDMTANKVRIEQVSPRLQSLEMALAMLSLTGFRGICDEEDYAKQAMHIILETSQVYWRGREPLSVDDIKRLTIPEIIKSFEGYLGRQRTLLDQGAQDINTAEGRELFDMIMARRQEESRVAMFSGWFTAIGAWNRGHMRESSVSPSTAFWTNILDELKLTWEQQQKLLAARRQLLSQLEAIRQHRETFVLAVGLLLMQRKPATGQTKEEKQLRDSVESEREAVLDFLHTVIDTLLPWQEAVCDLRSYPWWPDVWTISNILAARHKKEPNDTISGTMLGLLPHLSAAELLQAPMLAMGSGLQLKRGLVSKPTADNVLEAAMKPQPSVEMLRPMTLYDIYSLQAP